MARYTSDQINSKIALWEAADDAVSTGQSYSIAGRQLTRVDAAFIEKKLDKLYAIKEKIDAASAGRFVVRTGRVSR